MTSQTFSNSLDFVGSSLSSQGTGVPAGIDYSIPASLDPSFGTSFSTSLGSIPISGAVSFKAGLTGSLAITLGQFSPNIPVNVAETASASTLTAGQVFTVSTALTGSGSESFSMLGPGLTANLDLGISGSAGFFINKGSLIGASISINPSFSIAAKLPTSHAFSLPDNIGSVIIAEPMPFTSTGSASPTTGSLSPLSAMGTDTSSAPNNEVLGGTINFLGVVQAVVPEVALAGSLSIGVASISYNLLSVPLNLGLGIDQSMTLTPLGIGVSLTELEGSTQIGQTQTGSLGQTFSFQAPTTPTADPITINTTYSLDLGVMTNTGITGVISLNIVGPQASASAAFGLASGSIGPLFNVSLFNASTGLGTVASESFDDTLTTTSSLSIPIAAIACYLRGTRVETERGGVAVEDLTVGDLLRTASGALRPVRWLGHRGIDCTKHPDPMAVWPVRVESNAFGDGKPFRDLYLSPGHAVLVDDVLIQASNLVNGSSIAVVPRNHVEYWHVELDSHDVILAEGLPAESYLDTGNRTAFINGGAYLEMHPDFLPKHWQETCAPLVMEGPELECAKRDLLTRAQAMGYEISADADVHLMADGRRIDPIAMNDERIAFVLPEAFVEIELRSRTFIPDHVNVTGHDPRVLGICVQRLQLDGVDSNLSELTQGWHALERDDDGQMRRWTEGRVPLPVATRLVVIDLGCRGFFWTSGPEQRIAQVA